MNECFIISYVHYANQCINYAESTLTGGGQHDMFCQGSPWFHIVYSCDTYTCTFNLYVHSNVLLVEFVHYAIDLHAWTAH